MGPKVSKPMIVIRDPSRGRNQAVFDNTPLTAGHMGLALGLPFLKVYSLWACSYVFWVPSSIWPVVLRQVQQNLLITSQTLPVQLGDSPGLSVPHHYICYGIKGSPVTLARGDRISDKLQSAASR